MNSWGKLHNPSHVWPLVVHFLVKLQDEIPTNTKLYALGHCFGGKYALKLAQREILTAVIAMHPV